MSTGLGTVEAVSIPEADQPAGRRTWLRVLVIVVLVGLVADVLAGMLQSHLREPQAWPTLELQHKFDRLTAISGASRGGTVLFGDSLLDAGADPSSIDGAPRPVFNASLAGETLPVISSWATRVVTPRLHPSLVILGFTVNIFNGRIPGEPALVSNYERSRTVQAAQGSSDLLDQADRWLRTHVALYRDRSVLRSPFTSPLAGGAKVYDPPLSPSGWNEDFRAGQLGASPQAQAAATAQARAGLFAQYELSRQKMIDLGKLIDQLRRDGARVIVVAMPVSSAVMPAVGGGDAYHAALTELLSVAAQHGAPAFTAGVWPDRDFADAVHMNESGTERFGAWLSTNIAALTPKP